MTVMEQLIKDGLGQDRITEYAPSFLHYHLVAIPHGLRPVASYPVILCIGQAVPNCCLSLLVRS